LGKSSEEGEEEWGCRFANALYDHVPIHIPRTPSVGTTAGS
jgi:hypothetical protein